MKFLRTFIECYKGKWTENNKVVIKCRKCSQLLRVPTNKGKIEIVCSNCSNTFLYSPHLFIKKYYGAVLMLLIGIIFAVLIAYLNSLYDITGFYLLFIIPVGAIALGLLSNMGGMSNLVEIRSAPCSF